MGIMRTPPPATAEAHDRATPAIGAAIASAARHGGYGSAGHGAPSPPYRSVERCPGVTRWNPYSGRYTRQERCF